MGHSCYHRSVAAAAAAACLLFLSLSAIANGLVTAQAGLLPPGCYLHPSASIVHMSPTERGVKITGQILPNQVVLSVPLEHIVTPDQGRQTPTVKALIRNGWKIDNQTCLALWICHAVADKRGDADITNFCYEDTLPLPDAMRHLPLFWSDDELSELQGSRVRTDIFSKREELAALYDAICDAHVPFGRQTSLDTFFWATACVQSRAFRLRENYYEDVSIKRDIGLVLLADMLNHKSRSDSETCDWRVERDGSKAAFIIRSSNAGLSEGSEACHSYGLYPNAHYLAQYGFALEENRRHDGACPDEARIYTIGKDGLPIWHDVSIGNVDKSTNMLATFRAHVATGEERRTVNNGTQDADSHDGFLLPCCQGNERAAISLIKLSVNNALERYSTTLEEDLRLLKHALGSNRRNAVLVRAGEKHVLWHWLHLCHACLACLDDVERGITTWQSYCKLLDATLRRTSSIAPPITAY